MNIFVMLFAFTVILVSMNVFVEAQDKGGKDIIILGGGGSKHKSHGHHPQWYPYYIPYAVPVEKHVPVYVPVEKHVPVLVEKHVPVMMDKHEA